MKWLKLSIFLVILTVFLYLRLTPIINQTVPYTYDQGRDFLKAEEMIRDHNITFIGPTTGIQGVYHGVWWYYFLLIPYLIFSGWPQGFYIAQFLLYSAVNLAFFWFLKRNYNYLTAILFLAIISVSTFFIRTAFFASNNTLTPAFVLFFVYSLYKLFDRKEVKYIFLTGLSMGFIFETEMAFGLFIIPAFLISSLFFKETRKLIRKVKNLSYLSAGLIVPVIPRVLFEIKNNFSQTKSFLNYFYSAKNVHPVQFYGLVQERAVTFWQYWQSIFYQENFTLALIFLFLVLILIIFKNKIESSKKLLASFLILLLPLIFMISLVNKNSFFWTYYLDGVQYILVFLILSAFYLLTQTKKLSILSYFFLITMIIINLFAFTKDVTAKKPIPLIGLRADNAIMRYVLQKNQKKDFCLRIYTPPVFPFTYRYLLDYYIKKEGYKIPKDEPVDNRCWYIVDFDEDKERIEDWLSKNLPSNSHLLEKKIMENKTRIELWSVRD
ncbi:glycosyltransferase family 39 protein [Candidatus Roizmanbacteria bacterium]|nr:glycosyltransferase family 39 protein [Candidatus Roizmanbacteria bacterium]